MIDVRHTPEGKHVRYLTDVDSSVLHVRWTGPSAGDGRTPNSALFAALKPRLRKFMAVEPCHNLHLLQICVVTKHRKTPAEISDEDFPPPQEKKYEGSVERREMGSCSEGCDGLPTNASKALSLSTRAGGCAKNTLRARARSPIHHEYLVRNETPHPGRTQSPRPCVGLWD